MSTRPFLLALCIVLAALGTAAARAQSTFTQSHVFSTTYSLNALGTFTNLTSGSSFAFDGFAAVAPGATLNSVGFSRSSVILVDATWTNSSGAPITVSLSGTASDETIKIGTTEIGPAWSTPFPLGQQVAANSTLPVSETISNSLFSATFNFSNAEFNLFLGASVPTDFANTISFTLDSTNVGATTSSGLITVRDTVEVTYNYTAIPEPSTYVVVAGLGALGFALWRRRR